MKRLLAAASGAVLVMSVLAVPAMGGAGPTYTVQLGGHYGDFPAAGNNFYPDQIQLHPADQLSFVPEGFHSATLLPLGEDPDAFFAANAAALDDPYFLLHTDPDDGAKGYKYSNEALLGTESGCGTDTACNYDGSRLVSSNLAIEEPFLTRLDVPAGSQLWAVCLIHHSMRMQIDVVDTGTPVQTQAEIDADTAARLEQEGDDARALYNQLKDQHSSHDVNGQKVWDVSVGHDTDEFSLYGFFPTKQKVKKGQAVEYHFEELLSEDHTASIDRKRARSKIVSKDFLLLCDTDGDQGSNPDTDPAEDFPFCDDISEVELDAAPRLVLGAGDGEYRGGTDLESSPISGANLGGVDHFTVEFPKNLDKTTQYICAFHPDMIGKIVM